MKKSKWGYVLATMLLGSALFNSVAEEKTYRWKMQRYTGSEMSHLFNAFNQAVKERSKGQLQIKIFEGGELIGNSELLKSTGNGIVQMSYGNANYWSGEFPLGKLESGLAMSWSNEAEVEKLWNEYGFQQILNEAYQKHGVRYMSKAMGGNYDLLSKNPVLNMADMQKAKIRTGAATAALLNKFDIATVYLPTEEIYTALSTNAIDGVIYGSDYDYEMLKLNESAKHYTKLGLLNPGFIDAILVNEKAWSELPADLQTILTEEVNKLAIAIHQDFLDGQKRARDKNLFTYHEFDPTDLKKFSAAAQELWEAEAKLAPENRQAVDAIIKMAKDNGRL